MAFMIPAAERFRAYHVETEQGTEIVPETLTGRLFQIDGRPHLIEREHKKLLAHCEGSRIASVVRREGWYGRLSASGYLDCTEWCGPYATADKALDAVKQQYDVDDEGETLDG